jgi:hypothetical protein
LQVGVAAVAKLVDAIDSKSVSRKGVPVRFRLAAPRDATVGEPVHGPDDARQRSSQRPIASGDRMLRLVCAVAVAASLAACASPSLRYSSTITASENPSAREVPTRNVALKDRVVVVTHVNWPETDAKGGQHAVRWNWYEGETLIAERAKTLDFGTTPYRFFRSLPASDLGIGHYRVEVLVDGVRVDEQTFDVVAY